MKKILIFILFGCFFLVSATNLNAKADIIIESPTAISIELSTNTICFKKDIDKKIAPASMTKLMTILIILDCIENNTLSFNDEVTCSKNVENVEGSKIFLEENEKMSVEDLFKGLVIASGNDAAICLAEAISGSETNFVIRMNEYAKELNLKNTNFVNCSGIPVNNHYSTVYDISQIARHLLLKHEKVITKYTKIYEDYLRESTKPFWLVNTNKLVKYYDHVDGLKTGYDGKLYSLCLSTIKNNTRLITVVSGATSSSKRNFDAMTISNYVYNNYELLQLVKKGDKLKTINNIKVSPNIYHIVSDTDINIYKPRNIKSDIYTYKINIEDLTIDVFENDKLILTEKLTPDTSIKQKTIIDLFFYVLKQIFY